MEKKKKTKKSPIGGFKKYLEDVAIEAKKVVWPTKQKTINLTLIVLAVSTVIALLMTAIDYVFNLLTIGS